MSGWTARRFWAHATVAETDAGFAVHLDARPVRTPAKAPLILPTRALADAVAAEWAAQQDVVDPRTMPITRTANAAIDKVGPNRTEVAAMLADYGDADLTCYRAEVPPGLVARQSAAWDPLLDWADGAFGARLIPVAGVVHRPQSADALARLAAPVKSLSAFELAGFNDLVTLSGSLVIGLAAAQGFLAPEELWTRSRIDEDWQREQWGQDDEADEMASRKRRAFLDGLSFCRISTKT